MRPGASLPSAEALRVDLGLREDESVPSGDPDRALVPFARRMLARQRQQMLATMVMLGMQRIVIESGRIHASMRFHIDTRSAAQEDRGSRFDFQNQITASGSIGAAGWGASASMSNTIGYVSTQRTQTTEEMNTDLDLNSSVELVFKTDYLPLERLAGGQQADRIRVNTLNPDAEAKAAADARTAREGRITAADTARRTSLDSALAPRPITPAPPLPPVPTAKGEGDKTKNDSDKAKDKTNTAPESKPSQPAAASPSKTESAPAAPPKPETASPPK
jgi:hypothetical protein